MVVTRKRKRRKAGAVRLPRRTVIVPSAFIQPTRRMADAACRVWLDVVAAHAADYFTPAQVPILRAFCNAAVRVELLEAKLAAARSNDDQARIEERLDRLERRMFAAARSLRITLQSQRPPPMRPSDRHHGAHPPVTDGQGAFDWRAHMGRQLTADDKLPN